LKKVLLGSNKEKLDEVYNEIEKDYYLLGCTAIEDQLQEKVPECIKDFISIGIKVWVLTGDKPDTSISVAFSAKLIDHEYRIFDFNNLVTKEMYLLKIFEYLEHIESNKNGKYGLILQTEELKIIQSDYELVDKVKFSLILLVL